MKEAIAKYFLTNLPKYKVDVVNFTVQAVYKNIQISFYTVQKGRSICEIINRDNGDHLFNGPIRNIADFKNLYELRKIESYMHEKN